MSLFGGGDFKRYIVPGGPYLAVSGSTTSITVPILEANSFVHAVLNTVGGTVGTFLLTTKTPSTSGGPGTIVFTAASGNTCTYDIYVMP